MQDKDKDNYQKIFNNLLKRVSGILAMSPDAQKRVRKALYDFSDELKDKDLLKDQEIKNANREKVQ